MSKFIISLSPHVHGGDSVEKNMYGVCVALVPALLAGLYFFGLGAAIVLTTSVVSCVAFEFLISKYILGRDGRSVTDGSAILTGLLLGFNLPSNLPLWLIVLGALVAIGVGKMTFGGLGQNPFNPALVGRVFLLISFPVQMTSWPVAGQLTSYLDAQTAATPLGLASQGRLDNLPDATDLLLGNMGGSLGEVSALALLLGCAWLLWKRIITWHIPVSILGTVAVLSGLLYVADPSTYMNPLTVLTTGGLMLGACFMATDYVTSPMTPRGQVIYGVMIGIITLVIRNWGAYPEGMSFAILIMNAFTPLINTYCKPRRFGTKK
ncbi:MAG: RnfABCDGE type electron transport complex subunit D [Bacteroidaceae bacterium]|nr:RnfABCDGE type electron transport complex subunit D [Bacteroidaceae bacterium]